MLWNKYIVVCKLEATDSWLAKFAALVNSTNSTENILINCYLIF